MPAVMSNISVTAEAALTCTLEHCWHLVVRQASGFFCLFVCFCHNNKQFVTTDVNIKLHHFVCFFHFKFNLKAQYSWEEKTWLTSSKLLLTNFHFAVETGIWLYHIFMFSVIFLNMCCRNSPPLGQIKVAIFYLLSQSDKRGMKLGKLF